MSGYIFVLKVFVPAGIINMLLYYQSKKTWPKLSLAHQLLLYILLFIF